MNRLLAPRTIPQRAALATVLGPVGLSAPPAHAAEGGDWEWVVAPYVWATSINTDMETGRPPDGGISTDTGFDDVLEDLDGAVRDEGRWKPSGAPSGETHHGCSDPA